MKTTIKILAVLVAMVGFSAASYAQSATAAASATIVVPISITKNTDLNFGTIYSNASGGTVAVATNSTATATGVTRLTSGSYAVTPTAAKFTVSGDPNKTYTISMSPASVTVTNSNSKTMTIGSFVSSPTTAASAGLLDGNGSQEIFVGATLTVGENQETGVYTNATAFTVTVNYP